MSCCNQKNNNMVAENYEYSGNYRHPLDYDVSKQTYTIDNAAYYAPPWPVTRTVFDMNAIKQFSTSNIPDYLNYSSDVKEQMHMQPNSSERGMSTGRYNSSGC